MTIYEHIDSWNNDNLYRISHIADGINQVKQTHGMTLKSSIDLVCQEGGFSIEEYYTYLEILKKRNN